MKLASEIRTLMLTPIKVGDKLLNLNVGQKTPIIALIVAPFGHEHNLREQITRVWLNYTGPRLKFYLFPLSRPTLKKGPTQKKIISIFSQEFIFFKFHCKLREFFQCKQCYISSNKIFSVYQTE